jgi:tight adherence protein C
MELTAALIVFGAVVSFVLALGGRQTTARSRLDAIRPRTESGQTEEELPMSARIFAPTSKAIAEQAARLMPSDMLKGIEHKLILAGEPMTVNGFIMMRLICGALFLALPLLIVLSSGMQMSLTTIGLILAFAFIGLVLPGMWLSSRVAQRQKQIIKSLPDAFDLITTCVEAGLGLDAALARVAEKVEGPFADELSRMLREVGLGKMRSEALRELSDRTGVPDLTTFVNAVIQAERMGSSVGLVLRVQADQLRVRRRQRAEQQAYKAPVKMIFPLVLCIFPTLFIVILGPAAITIMRDFPAGK